MGVEQGHDRTLQLLDDCGPIIYAAGPANATSLVNNPDAGADSGVPLGRLRHASLCTMPSCLEIRRHNALGALLYNRRARWALVEDSIDFLKLAWR
jgi:hypothetical protein